MRRRRALLVAAPLLAALALAPAGSAPGAAASTRSEAPPPGFFGVGGWSYPSAPQAAALAHAGLQLVRGSLAWGTIQTSSNPSSRNWADPDRLAQEAAADHFSLLFNLNGCAVWACGKVYAPPTGAELANYEAFVSAAVARYAPNSPFWAGKSDVPTVAWQVWNEVNGGYFWPDPTPAAYATFLSEIAATIRSLDPSATIVSSGLDGLPGERTGMALGPFLRGLYRQPEFRSSFNVVGVQGYAPKPATSEKVVKETRRIMLQNGDRTTPIWVTEMGWAAGGPRSPFTVSPATQRRYRIASWDKLLACRTRWNLQHVLWFSLQDYTGADGSQPDYWGYHDGLIKQDGAPKPAYATFLRFLGRGRVPGNPRC